MLGSEPENELLRTERLPGDPFNFSELQIENNVKELKLAIEKRRNLLPFNHDTDQSIKKLLKLLNSNKIETRLYSKRFLHAKAFLISGSENKLITGSSNLTYGGMKNNLELNLGIQNSLLHQDLMEWFDELWNDADPYDLSKIYEELYKEYTPYEIYLIVLWQLYGQELLDEANEGESEIRLSRFQQHGVKRALRILDRYHGVMIADGVGLGKTYLGLAIMKTFVERKERVLIICPAALCSMWEGVMSDSQLFSEVISFNKFRDDSQFGGEHDYLNRNIEEYALVIIDEAHSSQSGSAHDKMNRTIGKDSNSYSEKDKDIDIDIDDSQEKIIEAMRSRKVRGNASYFAFTATPKKITLEKFGTKNTDGSFQPFHLYTMKQAIKEGFILDVLSNYTTYKSYYEIKKSTEDNPLFNTRKAQKKLRVFVERNPGTINVKAEIMLDHFIEKIVNTKKLKGKAKGIIITQNIESTIRYFKAIRKLLNKEKGIYIFQLDQNNYIKFCPERGGVITNWVSDSKEILYFDEKRFIDKTKSIRGGIPILFPICGNLNISSSVFGVDYSQLPQHGFARDLQWQYSLSENEKFLCLFLNESKQTKKYYPYDFELRIKVILKINCLEFEITIHNKTEIDMPINFGLHPYFNVSDCKNLEFVDYPLNCQNQEKNIISNTFDELNNINFGVDLLMYTSGRSSFIDKVLKRQVTLNHPYPFDLGVIWSDPPRRMICLEPWTSPRNSFVDGFRNIMIPSNDSKRFYASIQIKDLK